MKKHSDGPGTHTPLEAWIAASCTQPGWADESVRYVWKHCPLEMKETRKQQIFSDKGWWPAFLLKTANQTVVVLFFQNSSLKSRHSSYPIQTARSGVWKKPLLLRTPPVHIRSHHIKASRMKGRRKMPILLCFNLVGIWVSAYAALWMNKLLWRPEGCKSQIRWVRLTTRGGLLARPSAAELQEEPLQCGFFWICAVHGSSRMAQLWDWRT